jgi:hypothetical protein
MNDPKEPICPSCGDANSLVEIDSIPRKRYINGFNKNRNDFVYDSHFKYLDSIGDGCFYECESCGATVDFDDVYDATFGKEEE